MTAGLPTKILLGMIIGAMTMTAVMTTATAPALAAALVPDKADGRRSGFDFMSPALRSMQLDETANPGLLWVKDGEALWTKKIGSHGSSCASCHGEASQSMHGVAARYPAFDDRTAGPLNLSGRINACRVRHQGVPPLKSDDDAMLALEAFIGYQSQGRPLAPPNDARLDPHRARGEAIYRQRMGQLELSCAQCHDANAGQRLAGSVIPQAHPTGYPIYRLEWQTLGSLSRRVRGCMTGVRAEPFEDGALELIELELYLKQRAAGMPVETPGVRP
jgi:sulfur-oxidizing protein SoxA